MYFTTQPVTRNTLHSPFGSPVCSRVSPSKIAKTHRIDRVSRREEGDTFLTLVNLVMGAYSPKTRCIIHYKTLESTFTKQGLKGGKPMGRFLKFNSHHYMLVAATAFLVQLLVVVAFVCKTYAVETVCFINEAGENHFVKKR
jgi:hypothetical protein